MKRIYVVIIIFIVILGGLYMTLKYLVETKRAQEQVSQTITEQIAATSSAQISEGKSVDNIPTATTTTPASWKTHTYTDLGLTIAYPNNLVARRENSTLGDSVLIIAFPKDVYFHWPLLDDARITISASSTCAEPVVPNIGSSQPSGIATTSFSLNGYSFTATQGDEVAAGNIYREVIYSTEASSKCYSFSLFDHGANGAGLYVSNQALIKKYDAQHATDMASVHDIFNSIVNSFRSM